MPKPTSSQMLLPMLSPPLTLASARIHDCIHPTFSHLLFSSHCFLLFIVPSPPNYGSRSHHNLSDSTFLVLERQAYVDFGWMFPLWVNSLSFSFSKFLTRWICLRLPRVIFKTLQHKWKIHGIHPATLYNWCLTFFFFLIFSDESAGLFTLFPTSEVTRSLLWMYGAVIHTA